MKFVKKIIALFSVSAFLLGCAEASTSFTLKDLKGQEVSLDSTLKQHKAVLLNFFATWCPPCREEIPDLIRLQKQYQDRGFTILGVNIGESQKKVSGFVEKIGINYPVVLDQNSSVARDYHVVGIPTSFLVSADGKILGEYHSAPPELFRDVEKAVR